MSEAGFYLCNYTIYYYNIYNKCVYLNCYFITLSGERQRPKWILDN